MLMLDWDCHSEVASLSQAIVVQKYEDVIESVQAADQHACLCQQMYTPLEEQTHRSLICQFNAALFVLAFAPLL